MNPDNSVNDASLETLEHRSEAETADKMSLADQLKTLACSVDEDGLYIVRGLIANDRIKETRAKAPGLVDAIVSPKVAHECPVSAALTEADKAALKRIAKMAGGAH